MEYNVKRLVVGKVKMRRKLFLIVVFCIAIIIVLDCFNIDISYRNNNLRYNVEYTYYGKVVGFSNKDDYFRYVVLFDDGQRIILNVYEEIERPYEFFYSTISFNTTIERAKGERNPGCFDYEKYLKSLGIYGTASCSDFKEISEPSGFFELFQKKLMTYKFTFIESLSEESRGLVSGILFGETGYLEEDIYESFKDNGTAHVLAVSGLHIGVFYGFITKLLGKRQTAMRFIITASVFMSIGIMAGWSPSVTRAVAMVMIKEFALYTDRRYDLLTAASAVAFVSVVKNPYCVFNTGFQMSFLAVLSISFILPKIPGKIPDFLAMPICVAFGTIPFQMYVFNKLTVSSILANIPIVFLIGIFMPITALQFILASIGLKIVFLDYVVDSMVFFIIKVNEKMTLMDAVDVVSCKTAFIICFYLILFFFTSEYFYLLVIRRKYKLILVTVAGILLFSFTIDSLLRNPISGCDVIFVDVGQGDCIHIRDGDTNILIDGGGSLSYNIGKNTLKPYLLKNGVKYIDLALATHLHTDHYKGLEELKEEGLIKRLEVNQTTGSRYKAPNISIETLWPVSLENDDTQDENENCSVFMIKYNEVKILVTGDLDTKGEEAMVKYYEATDALKADILKIGHHGSHTSTCDIFLKAVDPRFCVIQVGKNNYGHPSAKILEKLSKSSIITLRNDSQGAIGFSFKNEKIRYYTMIQNP